MSFVISAFFIILIYVIAGVIFTRVMGELGKRAAKKTGDRFTVLDDGELVFAISIWPVIAGVIILAGIGKAIVWAARPR